MKKDKYDGFGKEAKIITVDDILLFMKVIGKKSWIRYIPNEFIDLLNQDYDSALKSIEYIPNVYFYLKDDFKKNRNMRNAVWRYFRLNNRLSEIFKKRKIIMKRM